MNILFLTSLFPNSLQTTNGIFNLSRANILWRLGHNVQVIAPISLTPPERFFSPLPLFNKILKHIMININIPNFEVVRGFKVYHPKWAWLPRKWFWEYEVDLLYILAGQQINRIMHSFKPDIVITSWLHPFGTYAKYIKRWFNIPVFAYAEGSDLFLWPDIYPGWSNIKMLLERYVDRVILISKAMDQLNHQKRKIRNAKLIIDGYDEDIFHYNPYINNECFCNILSIGNLSIVKGHDILIKSLNYLNPNFSVKLIGDGPEKERYIKLVKSQDLTSRVSFLGKVNHEHLRSYIEKSDIFCMPSRLDAQPAAALEAMACGKPVVAAKVGGFKDIIIDGFNGYLCEPESPKSLAATIKKAHETDWNYKRIAEWTKENYGWKKSIKQLLNIINQEIK